MDRGFIAAVAFYVASVLLISIMIAGHATAVRDVSWIGEVENYIKKENWEPNREYIPLMTAAFFIIENGETQFFYLYSQKEFYPYIEDLLNSIDRQIGEPISRERLGEIMEADKVLELLYRFPVELGFFKPSIGAAYFVLEDKLGGGLEGTIIVHETIKNEPYYRYSVWEITDWVLW